MGKSVGKKRKSQCCGCNACAEICPRRCIEMKPDSVGFQYPVVDTDKCINCGACLKVCPLEEDGASGSKPEICYAARMLDPGLLVGSSSGGAAAAIASKTVEDGGVVYGCVADGLHVSHVRVDTPEGLTALKGSKYVQSDIRGICTQVRDDLKAGLKVAFFGTPCQTYGLKKFLHSEQKNLLLVDIVCHGVPSQKMLRDNIFNVLGDVSVDKITFRDGCDYRLRIFSAGTEVWSARPYVNPDKDAYFSAFLKGTTFRPSCYRCKFAGQRRYSDITVGDFWGLNEAEHFPSCPHMGTSVILPTTEKGKTFVSSLSGRLKLVSREVEEAVRGNSQLRSPVRKNLEGIIFFILYSRISFATSLKLANCPSRILSLLKKGIKHVINR